MFLVLLVLIVLQILILCSLTHLKVLLLLRLPQQHLKLWIHLYVNPCASVSLRSYQILFILVILRLSLLLCLLSIVFLSLLPIKRQFLILFGSKLWMRNFLLYTRLVLGIWFLYLLVKVLLDVGGFTKSKLNLMDLLRDTKQDWLQNDICNSMRWIMRRLFLLLRK